MYSEISSLKFQYEVLFEKEYFLFY